MLGLLSQPKPQSADTAIFTLCDRLANSLLIEDRKAAVLALRGLAHENRELVASNGLQGLFDVLIKDSHDPDSAKATLETLLILFNTDTRRRKVRNRHYISPLAQRNPFGVGNEPEDTVVSDISLWLTDRLLHNEEALQRVLELSKTKNDPFMSVYALQLISVMISNRPRESKQTLLASGGVAPLVSALGSVQEMVRDEALLLLNALTVDHLDLQKLVAFEGGFDRAFAILNEGGGPIYGGRFAEDCLGLIANLIEFNQSNQKLFTQSGYVSQWTTLLASIVEAQNEGAQLREQAIANIEAALMIGQLLCVEGAEQTEGNQNVLQGYDGLTLTMQIAFGASSPPAVRVAALLTASAIVNGNTALQGELLAIDVPYYDLSVLKVVMVEPRIVPVSQALLNWAVSLSASNLFDLRCASLLCLSSAFNDNKVAKTNFVTEQIAKYRKLSESIAGQEESELSASGDAADEVATNGSANYSIDESRDANLVEILAEYSDENRLNPFRIWFACAIVLRLFMDAPELKDQLREVQIGEEGLGMEVHSLLQAAAGEMQGSLQLPEPTAALGYLQLLAVWIYDDIEAVNELTQESSAIQALIAHQASDPLVESLAVIVLGICYSFCTKDSPLTRNQFHQLLTKNLGRDQYILLVRKFRQSHIYQHFDESMMFNAPRNANGSPAVYLDASFVRLMNETLGHISRAIDSNPDIEPSSRVTFEMLEEVKHSLHEKSIKLDTAEKQLLDITKEHQELKKNMDDTLKQVSESNTESTESKAKLAKIETELKELRQTYETVEKTLTDTREELDIRVKALGTLEATHKRQSDMLKNIKSAKEKAEEGVNGLTRELFQLQRAKEKLEADNSKLQSELNKLKPKLEKAQQRETELSKLLKESRNEAAESKSSLDEKHKLNEKLVMKLRETASSLKHREEEEEELRSNLSKLKLEKEDQDNEFITLKNREASARKSLEVAQTELEKLKATGKNSAQTASNDTKEVADLQIKLRDLEKKLAAAEAAREESAKKKEDTERQVNELKKRVIAAEKAEAEQKKSAESLQSSLDKIKDVNNKLIKDFAEFKKNAGKEATTATPKANGDSVKAANDNESSKAKEEAAELNRKLEEKQQSLDELMILLDDLTEKKSLYKNKLRELKEEVSDSDEDDDEDDNEDEDES